MKLTHKLCGAALLAVVGVALAIPGTTKAAENPTGESKAGMDIEFAPKGEDGSEDLGDNSGNLTDPEISVPYKLFGVEFVSPLEFGEAQATATERTFWAKNWTKADGTVVGPNQVLINDDRMTGDNTYYVKAEITKELTANIGGTNKVLAGSILRYRNLSISTTTSEALALDPATTFVEDESADVKFGSKATIIDNSVTNNPDKTKGQGKTYLNFGNAKAEDGEVTSEKSVSLTIAADQQIVEGKYNGEITWYMENTL